MNMSLVLRLPRKMHLCRSSAYVPRLPSFLKLLQNPHVSLTLDKVHNPRACPAKRHLNVQKCFVPPQFFAPLTSKCASRHNCVHFFDISTFKVLRSWGVLYILTWKCASCHNGVQLFISHLTTWLRTRRFSELTFRPFGATNHWKKHSISRLSYLLAHLDLLSSETFSFLIFFLLLFSSLLFSPLLSSPLLSSPLLSSPLLFSSLLFSLLFSSLLFSLLFSDSSHLCFSSVHIVGSLTSKLPSIRYIMHFFCKLCRWKGLSQAPTVTPHAESRRRWWLAERGLSVISSSTTQHPDSTRNRSKSTA